MQKEKGAIIPEDVGAKSPHVIASAFAKDFGNAEYAMKRSGYLRQNKKVAEASWEALAVVLGPEFFASVVSSGIAKTLISQPPRQLLANMQWSPPGPPLANVAQLIVNGVCRVRNSYIHGEKFTGGPEGQWERDMTLIVEAHAVLREALATVGAASR